MKTLILLFISFFLLTLPQDDLKTTFLNHVSTQYDRYEIVEDYTSPDYTLVVVRGIANEQSAYGVMFFSTKAKSHSVVLTIGRSYYHLPATSRGDINVALLKNASDAVLEILDEAQTVRKTIELDALSVEEFDNMYPDAVSGAGVGGRFTSPIREVSTLDIIVWVSLGLILLSSGIIFFLYKTKHGVFNPNRKVNYQIHRIHPGFPTQEETPPEVISHQEEPNTPSSESSPFVNQYEELYGEEEEDEKSINDILISNGIPEDYQLLSPHEKNDVMLKLMYLRDKKEISLAQYQQEVIKLWKKSV